MFQHERIEKTTGTKIYFADPHSPWQRGTNENTNGLLRRYLPKGTDLRQYSNDRLAVIAAELNDRPRLCLNHRTPRQAMQQCGWRTT
jgi:IS30 family transposase